MPHTAVLLIIAVFVVGVLHTLVPDHWVPITLIARQRGWSMPQVAWSAAGAGLGHTVSTLVIAVVVWTAGVAVAARFGNIVNLLTSLALVGFGLWVAIGALKELQDSSCHEHAGQGDEHEHFGHAHAHRHDGGPAHTHWHNHHAEDWHAIESNLALAPPLHHHEHPTSARTALLLVLGSSPMVEGIPAFFAAAKYGVVLLAIMSIVFAVATIGTYVLLCVGACTGLRKIDLGPLERYGEVGSGVFIAILGTVFLFIH